MITKQERQAAIELLMRGREVLLDAVEGDDRGPGVMEADAGSGVYFEYTEHHAVLLRRALRR
jgi:hypothetical protein